MKKIIVNWQVLDPKGTMEFSFKDLGVANEKQWNSIPSGERDLILQDAVDSRNEGVRRVKSYEVK